MTSGSLDRAGDTSPDGQGPSARAAEHVRDQCADEVLVLAVGGIGEGRLEGLQCGAGDALGVGRANSMLPYTSKSARISAIASAPR